MRLSCQQVQESAATSTRQRHSVHVWFQRVHQLLNRLWFGTRRHDKFLLPVPVDRFTKSDKIAFRTNKELEPKIPCQLKFAVLLVRKASAQFRPLITRLSTFEKIRSEIVYQFLKQFKSKSLASRVTPV
jgi:hypothetical protein